MPRLAPHLAAIAFACSLTACGGGGSASSASVAMAAPAAAAPSVATGTSPVSGVGTAVSATPAASPAPVAAIGTSVAASGYADSGLAAAVDHLNRIRVGLGMVALRRHDKLDAAAQAHATYLGQNGYAAGHLESAGAAGFTGTTFIERIGVTRYSAGSAAEAYAGLGRAGGPASIDSLLSGINHRILLLRSDFTDIGAGIASLGSAIDVQNAAAGWRAMVLELAYAAGTTPGSGPPRDVVAWPPADARVPGTMWPETVMPLPGIKNNGYPVSVHADSDIAIGTFRLIHGVTKQTVDTVLITRSSDVNALFSAREASLVPRAPLEAGVRYTAEFTGAVGGSPVSRTWSFDVACAGVAC